MKIRVNRKIIGSLNPCADRYENWLQQYKNFDGDIIEFLKLNDITPQDKLWVTLRLIPIDTRVIFALDCSFAAANTDTAIAADAADTDTAIAAANAANAAYAAANAAAYAAANAAAYAAANAAAYAAANAAANAAELLANATNAAAYKKEQDNQIEVLIYLIEGEI